MHVRPLLVAALILLVANAACGAFGAEPTLRPTYTLYPTYTPAPIATPMPTYTPFLTPPSVQSASTTIPTTEGIAVELESEEWFFGLVSAAFEKGRGHYHAGEYQAAIDSFKEALELYGSTSNALESWLGISYAALGEYEVAIVHLSNAIDADGDASDLINRATIYKDTNQCDAAIEDARGALALEPVVSSGWHTDVEANVVLAVCYAPAAGERLAALQHIDAAISIAEGHEYSAAYLSDMKGLRGSLRAK